MQTFQIFILKERESATNKKLILMRNKEIFFKNILSLTHTKCKHTQALKFK